MHRPIFLHYTQAELDRNFDQRGWARNALDVIGRFAPMSDAAKSHLVHHADVPFGPGNAERLDIFPAATAQAPVMVFIHGGAWRNFGKDDFAFVAEPLVAAGITTVIPHFDNLPSVRLPQMADQVRRALAWTAEHIAEFGGDADRLYLSGHSSGAHLASLALEADWGPAGHPFKGCTLVSGVYDLEPVMLSARSSYVFLEPDEVSALSAQRHVQRMACPIKVLYAEYDTDEFQRQSQLFAECARTAGLLDGLTRLPGLNHFEIMESFADSHGPVVQAMLSQMGKADLAS